jgi:hypothetical protein
MAPPLAQGRRGNAGLALLVVLLLVGVGFAVHFAWVIAAIFFVIWLVGFGLGRGESAGRHHFYRRELTTPSCSSARQRIGPRVDGPGGEVSARGSKPATMSLAEGRPVLSGVCRERARRP